MCFSRVSHKGHGVLQMFEMDAHVGVEILGLILMKVRVSFLHQGSISGIAVRRQRR